MEWNGIWNRIETRNWINISNLNQSLYTRLCTGICIQAHIIYVGIQKYMQVHAGIHKYTKVYKVDIPGYTRVYMGMRPGMGM